MSKKGRFGDLLNGRDESVSSNLGAKEQLINTAIQEPVNTEQKKKATFEMDLDLHTKLKVFAANKGKPMVDVIEEALRRYLNDQ